MFIGHYAVAFALKGKVRGTSLGMLFIATQFVDILFFPFVLLGIEKLQFVEKFTEVNNFKIDFYPFTHGLLGSALWALLFFALYYFIFAKNKVNKTSIAFVMALAVLSHWFADLLMHTPDLPLINGEPKYGFGMWKNKFLSFVTEAILLFYGLVFYLKNTEAVSKAGKYVSSIFVVFLITISYLNLYVLPVSDDIVSLTISALFAYFLFAGIAHYIDTKRV